MRNAEFHSTVNRPGAVNSQPNRRHPKFYLLEPSAPHRKSATECAPQHRTARGRVPPWSARLVTPLGHPRQRANQSPVLVPSPPVTVCRGRQSRAAKTPGPHFLRGRIRRKPPDGQSHLSAQERPHLQRRAAPARADSKTRPAKELSRRIHVQSGLIRAIPPPRLPALARRDR